MPTPQRRAAVVELTNPPVTADASEPRTPTAEIASRPGKRNSLRCAAPKLDIYAPSIGGYASQPRPLKRDMRKSDQSVLKRSGAVEIMNIDSLIIFYCAVFGHGRQVSDWQSDHTRVVAISGARCVPSRCGISPPVSARSRPSFWRARPLVRFRPAQGFGHRTSNPTHGRPRIAHCEPVLKGVHFPPRTDVGEPILSVG